MRNEARATRGVLACVLGLAVVATGCSSDEGDADPKVSAKISVGQGPLSVAVSPDGRYAYTANEADVSVVDLGAKRVIGTIPSPGGAKEIKFSPDGHRAFIAGGTIAGTVSIIDTAGRTVTAEIPVDGGPLYSLAVSPDGRRVYAANTGDGLAVLDVQSRSVKTRSPLPDGGRGGVALSPDGRHAYIANRPADTDTSATANSVSVIDTAGSKVAANIPLQLEGPHNLAITPDGRRIYVTHFPKQPTSTAMSMIDTAAGKVTKTVPVEGRSGGLAVAPDGRHVYVANESGTVQVISTNTGKETGRVQVGTGATGVTVAPDGRHAYVTDSENTLSIIDTA